MLSEYAEVGGRGGGWSGEIKLKFDENVIEGWKI